MSIRYVGFAALLITLSLQLTACGGLSGFEARDADLLVIAESSSGTVVDESDNISTVNGPATISTKNALFTVNFPAIFELQVLDPDTTYQLLSWDYELNNSQPCIERIRADGAYVLSCGNRTGDLFVYLTLQEDFGQRTIIYQTYIENYRTVTEDDVFPNGR